MRDQASFTKSSEPDCPDEHRQRLHQHPQLVVDTSLPRYLLLSPPPLAGLNHPFALNNGYGDPRPPHTHYITRSFGLFIWIWIYAYIPGFWSGRCNIRIEINSSDKPSFAGTVTAPRI